MACENDFEILDKKIFMGFVATFGYFACGLIVKTFIEKYEAIS